MSNKKATAKANFEKTTLAEGVKVAEQLENDLNKICTKVKTAGSIRQGKEMVGDIDIVVIPKDTETFYDDVKELIDFEYGATKKIFGMYKDRPINIFVTTNESYGACLYQCTGPAIYNIHKRQMAKRKGFKLNEYGLFDRETNVQVAGHTEQSIFEYLEWDYKEPNKRKAPSWIAKRNKVTDETSIENQHININMNLIFPYIVIGVFISFLIDILRGGLIERGLVNEEDKWSWAERIIVIILWPYAVWIFIKTKRQ